jgi:hypothetical protein
MVAAEMTGATSATAKKPARNRRLIFMLNP